MNEFAIKAGYFDGKSAVEQAITVDYLVEGLAFQAPAGGLVMWPYATLRLVSVQRDNGHVTIGWKDDPTLRLRIKNATAGQELFWLAPHLNAERPERGILKPVLVSAAILLVMAGVYFSYPVARQGLIMAMPDSWVDGLADTMGSGILGSANTCDDPAGIAALNGLTERLTKGIKMPYTPKVKVINVPMVNAFAAPGGRVVILRGLLDKAETPDEVAGVLGHELSHVKHRHPLERLIDIYGLELFLGSIGGNMGTYGGLMVMMKYGRDDEREADETSLKMLNNAGISSTGFADFFARLQEDDGSRMPEILAFLSTHPQLEEREQTIRENSGQESYAPALDAEEW